MRTLPMLPPTLLLPPTPMLPATPGPDAPGAAMTPDVKRLRVKIFADGADKAGMVEMAAKPHIAGLTTKWFLSTWDDPEVRTALGISVQAGLSATAIALVLGSCAAFAIHRMTFFGRDAVSLLLVLPLALPGIITGMALNAFYSFNGINLSLLTIVIGHTTFCIVVVYNNVLARLRRTQGSLV